jgi:hypothetical protein
MPVLILAAAFGSVACSSTINPGDVPSVVQNALIKNFPEARDIDWDLKAGVYEAEFNIGKTGLEARFNKDGRLLESETDILIGDLPAPVKVALDSQYAGWKIDDISKIEKEKVLSYKIELEKKGSKDLDVVFGADGAVVK